MLDMASPPSACRVFSHGYCFGTVGSEYPNGVECTWTALSDVVLTTQRYRGSFFRSYFSSY